ncbi:aminotransferase class V-fold PLP-dependent enzyme [Maribacter cobaltidurans]|uniref:Aminotransferase n=1 Tax=Maribacter cobaltidurans TaxID=1178778 RepID=A0A223V7S7_9FLAO|nr:aminotransferase class V-fold PLP-dependent enzyme [Maribacter cobaltidurans]ASV31058.1 aminotransferase [Maribacter cobaltidurans]GGD96400.1 cysteine desulfurase [Maribacter cobaltidurans]
MEKIAKEFPVLRKSTYLNTAVYGPLYDSLIDWRQEHDLDFLLHGSDLWDHTLKTLTDTRETIGEFFNCKKENVALVYNFSIGLNLLLEGLDTKKKVLLLENDYPSLNWPFESRKFNTTILKITSDIEEKIEEAVCKDNIDVFAFSIVQWLDGFLIDLEFIKRLKKANPNLLIIADGTQFCGAAKFDFNSSGIDVMGTSGYKWLLSGYGNGFMLFSNNAAEEFSVPTTGFNAANGNYENKHNLKLPNKLEPGHLSSLNFGSLKFSLDFLNGIGMDNITGQNEALSRKIKREFEDLDLLEPYVVERKRHSTIFNIKADEKMFNKLIEENILCSQRGNGIRISFNFYNSEDDLKSLVRILKTGK